MTILFYFILVIQVMDNFGLPIYDSVNYYNNLLDANKKFKLFLTQKR